MKEKGKSYIIKILIPLVLLGVIGVIAKNTGLFWGLDSLITISLENIIKLIVAIAFIMVLENVLLMLFGFFSKRPGRIGTIATLISSIIKYVSILIGFCWGLSIIGVDVSTIFASIGIIALILGFGAESLVADLVTGVFILFENEYNVGDIIEVDGFRGTVKEIGLRTLNLEDNGGNVKIINNADLKNIINRSNYRSKAVCDIGISYDTDLEKLDPVLDVILADIKARYPEVFIGELKCIGVEALGEFSITLRFCGDVDEKNVFSGRRLLNKELKIAFDKNNISIPYPQMDIHTK